ncbi:GPI ethanolamine phosphate transferase 1 [Anthonomus grandis grandis]|uniref:GPI ethanolamine phosphate transferase 1 n=1 Tax=Anthonomus grandis grandis TaxID=2921223 RepID=UPI0021658B49|nr:GPI ethanolamine phosphate transferase 1 [Anthonomus grandis grandis]
MATQDDGSINQTKYKIYKIIVLGLVIHFLLLFAVFDIYFASPLDHGMHPIKSTKSPPAKRVVLFVADGLRAEAIFENNLHRIPFLKTVMFENGAWGVAHTRVPTESRPGHVAMLAGIYEDPSAIMKGWKANPVYFDSVINQSSNSWCWGSPDILNIFNKDHLEHIHIDTYSADIEDFGRKNTWDLDIWVFNKVRKFLLEEVNQCGSRDNCSKFFANGNIFFLHLLGIDTAGHGYKPESDEYNTNIKLVDKNIKMISKMFSDVFKDNATSFVFTADHGMTNWGSHGAGSAHETEAPLILWGAGIKPDFQRHDIKQVDIAPLLSSLIGINIPINSLGQVPTKFLDVPKNVLAEMKLGNTLQLLELFNIKRLRIETNTLVFLPYGGLTSEVLAEKVQFLKDLQMKNKFDLLITECEALVDILINGLDYYHNYYQYPLLIVISLGFIGWIFFLVASVLDGKVNRAAKPNKVVLLLVNVLPLLICYLQRFPVTYYIYFWFPSASFTFLVSFNQVLAILRQFKNISMDGNAFNILIYLVGIELLIYGFFNRKSFTILSLIIGLWVLPSNSFGKYSNARDKILWLMLCIFLSIFPLLPVMKTTFNLPMYTLGCVTWVLLFYEMYCRLSFKHQFRHIKIKHSIFWVQFVCLVLAGIYGVSLEKGLIGNASPIKYFSLVLLVLPISLIPFSSRNIAVRLISTFFGFAPFYLLVSSNYEVFFSSIFVAVLCNWLLIESKSFSSSDTGNLIYFVNFEKYESKDRITSCMFRRAFLFMVFIFLGFFGTGNIASLNSFDPMWVRAFLTVFSPFKMMGLILLKITVPFLFTCCVFRAINSIGKENILQMFCIILIFSDIMVLQFLYLITNVGSWLDIGSSLSHFVIMEGFVTILLVLYGLAHFLTTASYVKIK